MFPNLLLIAKKEDAFVFCNLALILKSCWAFVFFGSKKELLDLDYAFGISSLFELEAVGYIWGPKAKNKIDVFYIFKYDLKN